MSVDARMRTRCVGWSYANAHHHFQLSAFRRLERLCFVIRPLALRRSLRAALWQPPLAPLGLLMAPGSESLPCVSDPAKRGFVTWAAASAATGGADVKMLAPSPEELLAWLQQHPALLCCLAQERSAIARERMNLQWKSSTTIL